jgi:hypothetical protein
MIGAVVMYDAILQSLPIALGIVLATLPAIAIPLILITRREVGVLLAFMAGYAGGLLVVGGVVISLADLVTPNEEGPARWIVWLRILLGLTLLVWAWRKWRGRAAPGAAEDMPGWMKSIDTINAWRAAILGFALVALNPKNVVLVASGGLVIAQATPAPLAQVGALLVFTTVSGIGLALPYLTWITMGEAAIAPLDRLKGVMARNDTLIITTILAVLGLVVVVNALAYL